MKMQPDTPSPLWALGMMSGSSLDGIDAAIIQTDGEQVLAQGPSLTLPYDETMQHRLWLATHQQSPDLPLLERDMTLLHAKAANTLIGRCSPTQKPQIIGLHGQTVDHRPALGISVQIGNGTLLAEKTGLPVMHNFRAADLAAGGQGAPLVPLYHAALATAYPKPLAIINIGGIANITWLTQDGKIAAFDTGPGNVLMNDWVRKHTGGDCDMGGKLAAEGRVNDDILAYYLGHPYFSQPYPKSLDRNSFSLSPLDGLSIEDGAATLTAFTAHSIAKAAEYFSDSPTRWIFCGGGCHNPSLVKMLRELCGNIVLSEELGWDNDGLEAQAFAFFAVRAKRGLPLTFPETTGVERPVSGGVLANIADTQPNASSPHLSRWHSVKQTLQNLKTLPSFNEGEIWWCSIGQNIGFETYGKGDEYARPVFILQKHNRHSFLGLPLSSTQKKGSHFHYPLYFHDRNGSILLSQGRVLSSKRLQSRMGRISQTKCAAIRSAYVEFLQK